MEELADKKKAIFESTLALVELHGFHGTPMSMVAKNANVAAGTIYHYFKSKDELIVELYMYIKHNVEDFIDKNLQNNLSYKQQFFNIWSNLYKYYTENSTVLKFFEQYINSPYHKERCPHHFRGKIFQFLDDGVKNGNLKDAKPEMLLALFMGSVITSSKLKVFGSISFDDPDLDQLIGMLWEGMKNTHS